MQLTPRSPLVAGAPLAAALAGLAFAFAGPPAAAAPPAKAVPPPLAEEHLTVTKLGTPSPHWVWVYDDEINNGIELRMHLYDGDSYRRLGQIDMGFFGLPAFSPDGKTLAAASTYFSRGSKGARTDVVEFTDLSTLETVREVVLPPKHVQTLPTYFSTSYSSDGKLLYIPYLTPTASLGVVNVARNALAGEIDTAGCVLAIPGGPNRVSALCESGRVLTITLDGAGQELSRATSEPFFSVDKDPVFVQGVPARGLVTFLSFDGVVYEGDVTGPQASFRAPWSLVAAAEKGVWRPGGMQVAAINAQLGRLYVPMHKGGGQEKHKDGGTEIWVYDLGSHQRIARWPLGSQKLQPVISVQVSQDDQPLLFAATYDGDFAIYDGLTGKLKHIEKQLGQTPWMMFNP